MAANRPVVVTRVEGAKRLRATLRKAGDDLQGMKRLHSDIASSVARKARANAPKRTGRLKSTVRSTGTKNAAIVRAGFKKVPYANPIHWGWPRHGITPNRFVLNAARSTESTWLSHYSKEIKNIIATVKGK